MLKIGLTGGIGSGKSTVAAIFKVLGIPVFDADATAKYLMENDAQLKQAIQQQFGAAVYVDGQLQRKVLANIVFKDSFQLDLLNSLVHPVTIQFAKNWFAQQGEVPYAIKEAALIFESGSGEGLDYVIGVTAPTALRIQRVMQRDQADREAVLARMSKQLDENIKMKLCDFVVHNNEQQLLLQQVLAVDAQLRQWC
jgi:dephospho-CoA kinase